MSERTLPGGETADTLRLFVACELPPAWLDALQVAQQELERRLGPDGAALRWARPEGLHLTLHFLGATPAASERSIREALLHAADGCRPFQLRLGRWGTFGGRRPRGVWAGLAGGLDALAELQQRVTLGLGAETDGKQFSPHVTLARVQPSRGDRSGPRAVVPADVLQRAIDAVPAAVVPPFRVSEISLMQSELLPGGARYTRRFAAPLSPHDRD